MDQSHGFSEITFRPFHLSTTKLSSYSLLVFIVLFHMLSEMETDFSTPFSSGGKITPG